jgi:hypothetical protein
VPVPFNRQVFIRGHLAYLTSVSAASMLFPGDAVAGFFGVVQTTPTDHFHLASG